MGPTGHLVDELRRCLNRLTAEVEDPVARSYLDVSFLALEEAPTANLDISPDTTPAPVTAEYDAALGLLAVLAADPGVDQSSLVRCRVGLHQAAQHWTVGHG